MKKLGLLVALVLCFTSIALCQSQPSNTVTVTVQAVPAASVITVAPMNYYQSTAATLTITTTSTGVSSLCTGTWDTTALTLAFKAGATTGGTFTAPVTAAMTATLGSHKVLISCPIPVLSMLSPVTLPNAAVGQSYSANLATLASLTGGIPPYTFSLASGSLPTGLSLQSSGVISGTAASAASDTFSFTVTDSSGMTLIFSPIPGFHSS